MPCAFGCKCYFNKVLCNGKNLLTFPQLETISHEITWLDVTKNKIKDVSLSGKPADNYSNVKQLYLDFNELTELPASNESLFSVFTRLNYLSLTYNKIQHLTTGAFGGLHHLHELVLSNNVIKTIFDFTFKDLFKLNVLHLDHNQIENIADDAFGELYALEKLDLSANRIKKVEAFWFEKLPSIKKLHLGNNMIRVFDLDAFSWPDTLMELDLHNNNLTTVPPLPIKECQGQTIDKCQDRRATVLLQGNDIYCGCRRPEHDKGLINRLLPAVSVCCVDVQKVCPKGANGKSPQNYSFELFKNYLNVPVCEKPTLVIRDPTKGYNICIAKGKPTPEVKVTTEWLTQQGLNKNKTEVTQGMLAICEATNIYGTIKEVGYFSNASYEDDGCKPKNHFHARNDAPQSESKFNTSSICFPFWTVVITCCLSFSVLCFMITFVVLFQFVRYGFGFY